MRGLLLLVAARAAEASSEAAVLLVGAAYDVDEARLRATKKFVVDAFGARRRSFCSRACTTTKTFILRRRCVRYGTSWRPPCDLRF